MGDGQLIKTRVLLGPYGHGWLIKWKVTFAISTNLVPRVRVTLDQRSGTRDSGIKRLPENRNPVIGQTAQASGIRTSGFTKWSLFHEAIEFSMEKLGIKVLMKEQYDALLKSYMCRKKVCWWHCRQVSENRLSDFTLDVRLHSGGLHSKLLYCGARFCCYRSFAFERVYERPGAKTGRSVECVCLTKCGRRRRGRKSYHPGRYQEMLFDVWAPWSIRFVDNKNVAKMLKAKGCKPLLWTRLIWFLNGIYII